MKKPNYIFDLGNVLLTWTPMVQLRKDFPGQEELCQTLHDLIYLSPEWKMLDNGDITREEAFKRFIERRPDLEDQLTLTKMHQADIFHPIQAAVAVLPELKAQGHGVYFLSNYQVELAEEAMERHDFFPLFDGGVFSCDVHLLKPDPRIYQALLTKYELVPEECTFFDDMPTNVEGAKAEGMNSFVVNSPKDVLDNIK